MFCLLFLSILLGVLSNGYFGTEDDECALTGAEAGGWWILDTGRIYRISHVAITNVQGLEGYYKSALFCIKCSKIKSTVCVYLYFVSAIDQLLSAKYSAAFYGV